MRKLAKMILLPLAALIIGCATHYYQITDPATEKNYYTERVERKKGSVTFKDANSQRTVTLQSSARICDPSLRRPPPVRLSLRVRAVRNALHPP
jgi:hypothetical protein